MGDRSNAIRTRQRSHFLNATTLVGPWRNLTLSGGVQGESTQQEGIATGLSLGSSPARFASGQDRTGVEGNVQLRYTGLKNTVLTLGARLRGERTDLREDAPYRLNAALGVRVGGVDHVDEEVGLDQDVQCGLESLD